MPLLEPRYTTIKKYKINLKSTENIITKEKWNINCIKNEPYSLVRMKQDSNIVYNSCEIVNTSKVLFYRYIDRGIKEKVEIFINERVIGTISVNLEFYNFDHWKIISEIYTTTIERKIPKVLVGNFVECSYSYFKKFPTWVEIKVKDTNLIVNRLLLPWKMCMVHQVEFKIIKNDEKIIEAITNQVGWQMKLIINKAISITGKLLVARKSRYMNVGYFTLH